MCRVRGRRNDARALVLSRSLETAVRVIVETERLAEGSTPLSEPVPSVVDVSTYELTQSLRSLPSGEPSLGQLLSEARAKRPDYLYWRR